MRANLYPSLYFRQLGTKITIPRGYGGAVRIPRWKSMFGVISGSVVLSAASLPSAITVGLTEGDTAGTPGRPMCAESISGTTIQIGGVRTYSDVAILTSHANIVEGALESLVRETAWKVDRHYRLGISASSTLKSANGLTKQGSSFTLLAKHIAKIAPYMDASMTPRWPDQTQVMITHPLATYDFNTDISANSFLTVARYNDATMIYRGEFGQMYGVRFLLSNSLPVIFGGASSATTLLSGSTTGVQAYVLAPDSFYTLEREGGGLEVIHHPPGSSGSVSDQLNQYGSVGVKLHIGVLPQPQVDRRIIRWPHALGLRY